MTYLIILQNCFDSEEENTILEKINYPEGEFFALLFSFVYVFVGMQSESATV